jgi:hypothetical protein
MQPEEDPMDFTKVDIYAIVRNAFVNAVQKMQGLSESAYARQDSDLRITRKSGTSYTVTVDTTCFFIEATVEIGSEYGDHLALATCVTAFHAKQSHVSSCPYFWDNSVIPLRDFELDACA